MSKTLNEHWPYHPVEPGYLRTRPTSHSSSNSLRKSLPHTDPGLGCFSLPPYQGSELLRAASSFKRRRESRTLRSAVLSAAFLFVVFAVVGPSYHGLCLTGALHYKDTLASRGKIQSRKNHRRNSTVEVHMSDVRAASHSTEFRNNPSQKALGFCVDVGAPRSVIGRKELARMYIAHGIHNRHIHPPNNRFRFTDAAFKSLGKVYIPLKTPPGAPRVNVVLDIVSADIPVFLGMDIMDKEGITPCTI